VNLKSRKRQLHNVKQLVFDPNHL